MFIGHFAAAYAAKRVTPRTSLGWLFAACQWPDLLWPVLCLLGVEHFHIAPGDTAFTPLAFDYYPWSHSLLMDAVWGAALGLVYLARRGDKRGAWILGALVMSHWVLDWITHRPDMPVSLSLEHRVGLGLWNSVAATMVVEVAMFAGAVFLYDRLTAPLDRTGRLGSWILVGVLALLYFANVFSPPPPSVVAVTVSALGIWLFVAAAAWIDRHRALRAQRPA
ncbi:MAG TPA: hypothetical protein VJ867_05030 [Gemmatimonadaceae bacterium]|nr:hypothetical protein [Gemmatimonadaceae bacterium]